MTKGFLYSTVIGGVIPSDEEFDRLDELFGLNDTDGRIHDMIHDKELVEQLAGLSPDEQRTINDLNLLGPSLELPSMIPSDYAQRYDAMRTHRPTGAGKSLGEVIEGYEYGTDEGKALSQALKQMIAYGAEASDFDDILRQVNSSKNILGWETGLFSQNDLAGALDKTLKKLDDLITVTRDTGERMGRLEIEVGR